MVCNKFIVDLINWMHISEDGILKLKRNIESDHNTITAEIQISDAEIPPKKKRVVWRLNAPEEHWKKFDYELRKLEPKTTQLFASVTDNFDSAYKKFTNGVDTAAPASIGKTTLKNKGGKIVSEELRILRKRKNELRHVLKSDPSHRDQIVQKLKEIQIKIQNEILIEKTKLTNSRFKKMIEDKNRKSYWNETKKINSNSTNESLTVKNEQGKREYNPEKIKETHANH